MATHSAAEISAALRKRLEEARLDLLALFRALDGMNLSSSDIPQRGLRQLFELDADYAEALWALDQPRGTIDNPAMVGDTLAALDRFPQKCSSFRKLLPKQAHRRLAELEAAIRLRLVPPDAYSMVPGRDPQIG